MRLIGSWVSCAWEGRDVSNHILQGHVGQEGGKAECSLSKFVISFHS